LISVLTMIVAAVIAQNPAPAAPSGNAANGKTLFTTAGCYACHGSMGQGGPGGRLAPNVIPFPILSKYVRNGKANPGANRNWSGMPPFSTKFISDAQLADIYAFLASIPPPPPVKSIPLLNE
jgi:mono/diheme cytochrome c family protein